MTKTKDVRYWTTRVSPDEDQFLVDMVHLFYRLGLIKRLSRAEFLKYCIVNTCKQVIQVLKEGQYGRVAR